MQFEYNRDTSRDAGKGENIRKYPMEILRMNDEELDRVIQNVISRFEELHPDHEAIFMTLPKAPGREREEAIENAAAFLQNEKFPV